MKVLVTGGAGFIGSNLSIALEQAGHEVVVFDDLSVGTKSNLTHFKGKIIEGDIRLLSHNSLSEINPEAIFHQAAITDTTVYDEKLMMDVNFGPMLPLLKYVELKKIPLIYASSAAVYGSSHSPQKEDDAGHPLNIYGVSKWRCDEAVMEFLSTHPDAHVAGLRYFNVFGSGESKKGKMASMIYQLSNQVLAGQKPRIFKWGEQKRDFVYVKDIVKLNLLALEKKKSGIFNAGSGKASSFKEICHCIFHALGKNENSEIDYFDNPYSGKYQDHTQASLLKVHSELGYSPSWDLKSAITDYLKVGL